jgi:hypothetical protein
MIFAMFSSSVHIIPRVNTSSRIRIAGVLKPDYTDYSKKKRLYSDLNQTFTAPYDPGRLVLSGISRTISSGSSGVGSAAGGVCACVHPPLPLLLGTSSSSDDGS